MATPLHGPDASFRGAPPGNSARYSAPLLSRSSAYVRLLAATAVAKPEPTPAEASTRAAPGTPSITRSARAVESHAHPRTGAETMFCCNEPPPVGEGAAGDVTAPPQPQICKTANAETRHSATFMHNGLNRHLRIVTSSPWSVHNMERIRKIIVHRMPCELKLFLHLARCRHAGKGRGNFTAICS
jgi:hypothetical protein